MAEPTPLDLQAIAEAAGFVSIDNQRAGLRRKVERIVGQCQRIITSLDNPESLWDFTILTEDIHNLAGEARAEAVLLDVLATIARRARDSRATTTEDVPQQADTE